MKHLLVPTFVLGTLFLAACGNNETGSTNHEDHAGTEQKNPPATGTTVLPENVTAITPSFTQVDPKTSAGIQEVVQHYYHIQTALANDDANEAGNGGIALGETMAKVDKSAMPADQKALYEKNEEDLRMHAAHLAENTGNIKHQREHFETMSKDVYGLVKGFGAGRPVYKTFCPMAFNNKGAYWLSTAAEVRNPYFGKDMLTCGEVQEVIK